MTARPEGAAGTVAPARAPGDAVSPDMGAILASLLRGRGNDSAGSAEGTSLSGDISGSTSGGKTPQRVAPGGEMIQGTAGMSAGLGNLSGAGFPDLGVLLRDPKVMSMLPQVMAMVGSLGGGGSVSPGGSPDTPVAEALTPRGADTPVEATPALVSGGRSGGSRERRDALLCALRPYLSPGRQTLVDYVLKVEKIGKLLGG